MAGKKPGPPRKAAGERRDEHITIWLTPAEHDAVKHAAEADVDKPASWARRQILKAVQAAAKKGGNGR